MIYQRFGFAQFVIRLWWRRPVRAVVWCPGVAVAGGASDAHLPAERQSAASSADPLTVSSRFN